MRSGAKAWIALGAGVVAWDVFCPEGETLSDTVDRALLTKPLLTKFAVTAVAAHLVNAVTPNLDIVHVVFSRTRGWKVLWHNKIHSWGALSLGSSRRRYAS